MILTVIGVFFLVLAGIFAFAAFSDYRAAQHQWTIKANVRRRMAVIYGLVGICLILWQLFFAR